MANFTNCLLLHKLIKSFQAKSFPMSSQLSTKNQEETMSDNVPAEPSRKSKKKNEFESETSADEADTDNEMVFIRNPNGKQNRSYNVDINACNMSFLKALDLEESDSDNENGTNDKLSNAIGHLFTE